MKALLKGALHALCGDYSIYFILSKETSKTAAAKDALNAEYVVRRVDQSMISHATDPYIREQAGYAGAGALAYACFYQGHIVGVCFYWHGERYRKRNFWPLRSNEAKLVQIVATPEMRGRKVAQKLITHSLADVASQGFERAYARVWHSNHPSLGAFRNAGWTRNAIVVEVNPLRRQRPLRLSLPWAA
jgi:GNAT superfamily N-acetyltransferase